MTAKLPEPLARAGNDISGDVLYNECPPVAMVTRKEDLIVLAVTENHSCLQIERERSFLFLLQLNYR